MDTNWTIKKDGEIFVENDKYNFVIFAKDEEDAKTRAQERANSFFNVQVLLVLVESRLTADLGLFLFEANVSGTDAGLDQVEFDIEDPNYERLYLPIEFFNIQKLLNAAQKKVDRPWVPQFTKNIFSTYQLFFNELGKRIELAFDFNGWEKKPDQQVVILYDKETEGPKRWYVDATINNLYPSVDVRSFAGDFSKIGGYDKVLYFITIALKNHLRLEISPILKRLLSVKNGDELWQVFVEDLITNPEDWSTIFGASAAGGVDVSAGGETYNIIDSFNEVSIKTADDKQREDVYLRDPEFIKKAISERINAIVNPIGDLANFAKEPRRNTVGLISVPNSPKSLSEGYELVNKLPLNNYASVIESAAQCVGGAFPAVGLLEGFQDLKGVAQKFLIPTLRFPDNLFITDVLQSLSVSVEEAAIAMVQSLFVDTLFQILDEINFCYQPGMENEKQLDLANIISDVAKDYEDFAKSLGLDPETQKDWFGVGQQLGEGLEGLSVRKVAEDTSEAVRDLFKSVASLVSPKEYIELLLGQPSDRVIGIVDSIIGIKKYPFAQAVSGQGHKIKKLFAATGKKVGPEVLEKYLNTCKEAGVAIDGNKLACLEDLPEEIDRRKKILDKLKDAIGKIGQAGSDGPSPCDAMSNSNKLPPAFKNAVKSSIDGIFSGVKFAFDRDMTDWPNTIIEQRLKEKEITLPSPLGDIANWNIWPQTRNPDTGELIPPNPQEVLMPLYYLMMGMDSDRMQNKAPTSNISYRLTAPALKEALKNYKVRIQTDSNFIKFIILVSDVFGTTTAASSVPDFAGKLLAKINAAQGAAAAATIEDRDRRSLSQQPAAPMSASSGQAVEAPTEDPIADLIGEPPVPDHSSVFNTTSVTAINTSGINAPSLSDRAIENIAQHPNFGEGAIIYTIYFDSFNIGKLNYTLEFPFNSGNGSQGNFGPISGSILVDDATRRLTTNSSNLFENLFKELSYKTIEGAVGLESFEKDVIKDDVIGISYPYAVDSAGGVVASLAKNSVLFSNIEVDVQENTTKLSSEEPDGKKVVIPYITQIKFNHQPPPCSPPEIMNFHLLGLEDLKKEIVDNYLKGFCKDIGKEKPKKDQLAEISMKGVVKTTFRAYAIDYCLRNLFVFSRLDLNESLDDGYLEYIKIDMQELMLYYGMNYLSKFIEKTKEVYKEEEGPVGGDEFKYYLNEQLIQVSKLINEKILGNGDLRALKDLFIFSLPFVDIAKFLPGYGTTSSLRWKENFEYKNIKGMALAPEVRRNMFDNSIFKSTFCFEQYCVEDGNVIVLDPNELLENRDLSLERRARKKIGLRLSYVYNSRYGDYKINNLESVIREKKDFLRGKNVIFDIEEVIENSSMNLFTMVIPLIKFEKVYNGEESVSEILGQLKEELLNSDEFNTLFGYVISLKQQLSMLNLFNISYITYMNSMLPRFAFGPTRDQLKTLFDAFAHREEGGGLENPLEENYQDPAFVGYGGASGISEKLRTPIEQMSCFNLQGLFKAPMINFGAVLKLFLETPMKIFKGLTEFADPNIAIASKIAFALKLGACIEIPVGAISMSLQPATLMPGSWFGPPITPLGIVYLLLGLGMSFSPQEVQKLIKEVGGGMNPNTNEGSNENPYKCEENK